MAEMAEKNEHDAENHKTPLQSHSPVIVVLQLPPANLVDRLAVRGLRVVANNLNLLGIGTDKLAQQRANHRCHARRDDNSGNVVGQRPLEVLVETRVELDVLLQVLDAFRERLDGGDRVHLGHEGVSVRGKGLACGGERGTIWGRGEPEGLLAGEDIAVEDSALLVAHAESVCLVW